MMDWPVVGAVAGVAAVAGAAAVSAAIVMWPATDPVEKPSPTALASVESQPAAAEPRILVWDGSTMPELGLQSHSRQKEFEVGDGSTRLELSLQSYSRQREFEVTDGSNRLELRLPSLVHREDDVWDGSLRLDLDSMRRIPVPAGGGGGAPRGGAQPYDLTSFVKKWEADPSTGRAYTHSYVDQRGLSIGYGTAGRLGEHISEEEANRRLDVALAQVLSVIEKMNPNLSDGSKKALTSLLFNLGSDVSKLKNHGMAQAIMANDTEAMKSAHLHFSHVGGPDGKVLPGLLQRRKEELKFYELR
jgi:GH24 family phage-related lysozyme (muramidase)